MPGVFLHAAAIESVLTGRVTLVASDGVLAGLAGFAAVGGSALGLFLAPWVAWVGVAVASVVFLGTGIGLLERDVWVPMSVPLLALLVSPLFSYVSRYLVEVRARRRIQDELFYLSGLPHRMLDQMASGESDLPLGREPAEVSVMFADLSDFTKVSTQLAPKELAARCSQYLAYIVQQV